MLGDLDQIFAPFCFFIAHIWIDNKTLFSVYNRLNRKIHALNSII